MVTILICTDLAEGRAWASEHGYRPRDLVLTSPRSPHAARGFNAEAIYATPTVRAHPRFDELVATARPCLATRPTADRIG